MFTPRNVLRTIGPGIIGLGIAIGSGEWLLGPSVVARYGPALLWVTTVSVLLQAFLNIEMARYTMYTGEPVTVGFMRTRPGPAFLVGGVRAPDVSADRMARMGARERDGERGADPRPHPDGGRRAAR